MNRKKEFKFTKDFLILCTDYKEDTSEDSLAEEKRLLENTEMLNSHIQKITQKNKLFAEEVALREEELNAPISSQKNTIEETTNKIDELHKIIKELSNKSKQTVSTKT
ncbi:hypothetical protein JTB14_027562 [Gonioctena quinquepunctata]|nr:hypothetical protein JTB14_027562 [Gonioctena quinquepunctata]